MKNRRNRAVVLRSARKLLFAFLPAVLLFGSVEFLLHLRGYSSSRGKWTEYAFLTPHAEVTWTEGKAFFKRRIRVSLNNLGLRGRDVVPKAGTTSLLFIGDSITFGEGVEDGEDFPTLSGHLLTERIPSSPLRVVNGGVPGYGIHEEIELVKKLLPSLRPELVLLTFCVNDMFDVLKQQSPERYARYEEKRFSPIVSRSATARFLFLHYFAFLYKHEFSSLKINGMYPLERDTPDIRQAWKAYFASVQLLADDLRMNGVGLGLIVFPDFSQVVTGFQTSEGYFQDFGQEHGLPVLVLLESFRKRQKEGVPMLKPDGHPDSRAHRIIASAVVDWLTGFTASPPFPGLLTD